MLTSYTESRLYLAVESFEDVFGRMVVCCFVDFKCGAHSWKLDEKLRFEIWEPSSSGKNTSNTVFWYPIFNKCYDRLPSKDGGSIEAWLRSYQINVSALKSVLRFLENTEFRFCRTCNFGFWASHARSCPVVVVIVNSRPKVTIPLRIWSVCRCRSFKSICHLLKSLSKNSVEWIGRDIAYWLWCDISSIHWK